MFHTRAALIFVVAGSALAVSGEVQQSPAEDLFARKCASCHTVGKGVRVGPDLDGVTAVSTELVWEPPWDPSRIAPDALRRLEER